MSFPLYNEALKFACHGEKMIQTAVRALTLRIYNGIFFLSFLICFFFCKLNITFNLLCKMHFL